MTLKSRCALLLALLIIIACPRWAPADDDHAAAKAAAVQAAQDFLQLLDSGDYEQAWQQAAPILQTQITKEDWVTRIGNLRPLFGPLLQRSVGATRYHGEIPGGPDGDYVIISIDSSFAHKKNAVETVTTMLGEDGNWQIAGYFIK